MVLTTISSAVKLWGLSRGILAFIDRRVKQSLGDLHMEENVYTAVDGLLFNDTNESWMTHELKDTFLWFAVPKKRTSRSKKLLRMTHKWLKPIHHYTFCNHCGNPKLLHVLCGNCFKETMKKTAEYRRQK